MRHVFLLVLFVLFIIVATARFRLHPFLALLFAAFGFGLLSGMPLEEITTSVTGGFGSIIGYIGIVILAGTIIGTFLEKSGGALAIANRILKLTGAQKTPFAMSLVGYIVSIPVFCDSGFVILSSLNKALTKRAKLSLAVSATALSLGLYASHTMVPPTPGPIAAAGILGADLGQVILWGVVVSLPVLFSGYLFARIVGSRFYIDPGSEAPEEALPTEGPGAFKAFLPIVIPIVLIVFKSVADYPSAPFGEGTIRTALGFIGHPVVALLIGVFLAFSLPKNFSSELLSAKGWVGEALQNAAMIILITGAGGAFGKVLQNSGIAKTLGETIAQANLGVWLPFLVAATIKTAQGSSTVAMITTASIVAPLLESLGLDAAAGRVLTVIVIGAGSMVVSHANDSYFWIVTQLSNMDARLGYILQTGGTLVQGLVAVLVVWILSFILLPV